MPTEAPITNPYVGPRTFSYEQRRLFFGREREARDLLARVLSERLLLFYAQSGAGKSSLLYTRLIPQLQEEKGFVVLPVGRVGGELLAGVEQVDNIYAFNLMLSMDAGNDPARLAHVTLNDFLARLARRTVTDAAGQERKGWVYDASLAPAPAATGASTRRYALIIDQFEEIITAHPGRWQEREDFFRQLNQAMLDTHNLWAVLTLREDYVAALDPYAPLMTDRLRARFYMERMGIEAALDAIREPAAQFGRPFAAGVAETLRNDLCQVRVAGREETMTGQYVEPVQLQVVCYQLWEDIRDRPLGPITADDRQPGDVNLALIQFYEKTLTDVLAEEAVRKVGVSERQLRTWFGKELITDEGTRDLVRQGEETTGSLPNSVVDLLQKRFLVRGETRSGDTRIELVHDRFVEPILESNRAWFARNLNPLAQAAQAWQAAGKPESQLYVGSQLAAAAAQLQANRTEFGEIEQDFLEESQKVEHRRAARRQQRITWGAAALALVFIALAAWALWSRGEARTSAAAAIAARATAEADRIRAVAAEAEAVTQALAAQDARDTAIFLQGRESVARSQAEANALAAIAAKATAEAASTKAVAGEATTQAAAAAQATAVGDLGAALQTSLTAQAMAAAPPSPTASAASPTTPTGIPTLPAVVPGTPSPTGTPTPTRTVAAPPTPNLTIIAQQTQLAQVRATQTALAVAPPTGRIIFVSNRASLEDLYVMKPDGGQQERWTFNLAREPSYARGSSLLAFTKLQVSPWQLSIFVKPISGGDERRVTKPEDWDYWVPSIAPDGMHIAAASSHVNVNSEILIIDLDGNVIRQVTNQNPAKSWRPSWSPDGQRIAYASNRGVGADRSDIWVQDLQSRLERRLTRSNAKTSDPVWSRDGQRLAFISDQDGNRDVWVMDANGQNPINLTRSPEDEDYPAWSLDGNWLAFTRRLPNQEIFLMRADGSRVRNLTQNPAEDFQPVWVP